MAKIAACVVLALVLALVECRVNEPRGYSLRPYPGDCKSFYSCVSFKCPDGMVFNPQTKRCQVGSRLLAAPEARGVTDLFPDATDNTIYWECTKMPCPGGLLFNPVKLSCDDPMTAGCTD